MPSPTTLKIDDAVQVQLLLEERRDVIVVPQQAIQKDGTTSFVWIAGEDRQAHRREVRTGLASGSLIQVASGVAAGEQRHPHGHHRARRGHTHSGRKRVEVARANCGPPK